MRGANNVMRAAGSLLIGLSMLAGAGAADTDPHAKQAAAAHAAHAGDARTHATQDAPHAHAHDAGGDGDALLPIMQRLGSAMTAITVALMTDDAAQVAASAAAIAAHAPLAASELERIKATLGDAMAEFVRLDDAVHRDALRLHDAAKGADTDLVLARLNEVQRGCIACHVRFREPLRTSRAP